MDLAIFCDSLSAIGPPCGPFQPKSFRAQLLLATLWLPATPTLTPTQVSACDVDKKLSKMAGNSAIVMHCREGSLIDLE